MEPKICPVCEHPTVVNLSDHLIRSHNISGKEKKPLLQGTHFMTMSCKNGEPSICSATTQFGNSLPKTSSLPEQKKLPNPIPSNPTSDENEDQLIPSPYDSRISYERVWGTNVPVMELLQILVNWDENLRINTDKDLLFLLRRLLVRIWAWIRTSDVLDVEFGTDLLDS